MVVIFQLLFETLPIPFDFVEVQVIGRCRVRRLDGLYGWFCKIAARRYADCQQDENDNGQSTEGAKHHDLLPSSLVYLFRRMGQGKCVALSQKVQCQMVAFSLNVS